jgi:hypothetical protein
MSIRNWMLAGCSLIVAGGAVAGETSFDATVATLGHAWATARYVTPDAAKDAGAAASQPATQAGTTAESGKDQSVTPAAGADVAKSPDKGSAGAGAPVKATAAASKASRPTAATGAGTGAGSSETPAPAPAAVARTPASAAAPQPDRWQQMREAMLRCKREDFFRRIGCEQSVGLKYCDGYWGKVPQCPGVPSESGR